MKFLLSSYVVLNLLSISESQSNKAINYFIKHRKLKNFTMEFLRNPDQTPSNWIEYKYIFENDDNRNETNDLKILKVAILPEDNFDCTKPQNNNSTGLEGYSIDLITTIKENLQIQVDYIMITDYTNLTTALITHEIDLAICHINLEDPDFKLQELYPTLKSHYLFIYNPNRLHFTKDIFILTFAGSLWLVFFALLILLAFCLRISTTNYSMLPPKHEPWTWVEITLWAIAAACQQGLSNTPSGFASCLVFFLGYLMAYLLYTGFAAAITSILVRNDANANFNFKHINAGNLQLISLESSIDSIRPYKYKFVSTKYVPDLKHLFENLDRNDRLGIAPEIPLTQYMADNFNYERTAEYLTTRVRLRYSKGFLISRNNPWKEILNKQILALDESGILQNTLKRNLKPVQIPDAGSPYSSAGREHVGSAILAFLGGVLVAILFLLAEFVFRFYQKNRNNLGL